MPVPLLICSLLLAASGAACLLALPNQTQMCVLIKQQAGGSGSRRSHFWFADFQAARQRLTCLAEGKGMYSAQRPVNRFSEISRQKLSEESQDEDSGPLPALD